MRKALPEVQREIVKMPRAYICNIIYTFAGEPFAEFVNGKVRARNQKIQQEHSIFRWTQKSPPSTSGAQLSAVSNLDILFYFDL